MLSDLTRGRVACRVRDPGVLMHLMALRAFWPGCVPNMGLSPLGCLNAPYGAPCFLTVAERVEGP